MSSIQEAPPSFGSGTRLSATSRRHFFQLAGGLAGVGLLFSACTKGDDQDHDYSNGDDDNRVRLGSGDTGVLNYAYALEQLEAAFYTRVIESQYGGMTSEERSLLTDIRDHEIAHREFLKAALGASAIKGLTPDFSSVNFGSRASVLSTAKTFEDLGVSAYNGAGRLLTTPSYLLVAGKIVSVEARHAAYLRDLLQFNTFADSTVVDANGLDLAGLPATILSAAAPFIKDKIDASQLPNS